jgi:hypothetical protein
MSVQHTIVSSAVGPLTLVGDGAALIGLYFAGHRRTPRLTDFGPRVDIGWNPISIIVPCHRVVGTSGSLTGYAGGLIRKRFLLSLEEPNAAEDGRLF